MGTESVQNDELGYIGFETYEDDDTKWIFDRSSILRNQCWAYTGRSLLHLSSNGHAISRTFQPTDSNQTYRASCWIRVNNSQTNLKKQMSTGCFTATARSLTNNSSHVYQADLKLREKDWIYLEVDIPLEDRQIGAKYSITVKITCTNEWTDLDVNNVWFGPSGTRSNVYVYDSETRQMIARSQTAGMLFKRIIYSQSLEPLAVCEQELEAIGHGPVVKEILLTNNSYLKKYTT